MKRPRMVQKVRGRKGTKNPRMVRKSMVRNVHGTKCPQMVRNVYGTKSLATFITSVC